MGKRSKLRDGMAIALGAMTPILATAGWYLVTPRMTMEAMAGAVAAGNGSELASYMDMNALRADARESAEQALRMKYPPRQVVLNPKRTTEALVGAMIDDLFSVEGMTKAIARMASAGEPNIDYQILRAGPDHFVARLDAPRRVELMFTRHGLSWKLSGIAARPHRTPETVI